MVQCDLDAHSARLPFMHLSDIAFLRRAPTLVLTHISIRDAFTSSYDITFEEREASGPYLTQEK